MYQNTRTHTAPHTLQPHTACVCTNVCVHVRQPPRLAVDNHLVRSLAVTHNTTSHTTHITHNTHHTQHTHTQPQVLLDVAYSMDYLHERKLLHCDLKVRLISHCVGAASALRVALQALRACRQNRTHHNLIIVPIHYSTNYSNQHLHDPAWLP